MPKYLDKGWGKKRWRRIAKYGLGNGMAEARYWECEEERICRVCGSEEERWEHVWERCRGEGEGSWQENVRKILGEEGEEESWIRKLGGEQSGAGGGGRRRRNLKRVTGDE